MEVAVKTEERTLARLVRMWVEAPPTFPTNMLPTSLAVSALWEVTFSAWPLRSSWLWEMETLTRLQHAAAVILRLTALRPTPQTTTAATPTAILPMLSLFAPTEHQFAVTRLPTS